MDYMASDGGAWSPYLVGALIGLLSMATSIFPTSRRRSTAYARIAGLIGKLFSKRHTESLKFYQETKPSIQWDVTLLLGILLGAAIAAYTGGEIPGMDLPLWEEAVWLRVTPSGSAWPSSAGPSWPSARRLAGGCTSGHGISGALQLSVGSWVALICFFIGGMTTARLMFGI